MFSMCDVENRARTVNFQQVISEYCLNKNLCHTPRTSPLKIYPVSKHPCKIYSPEYSLIGGEILVPELDEVEAVTVPATAKPDSKQYSLEDSMVFDKPTLSEKSATSFPLSKEKEDNMGSPDNENGSVSKDETPVPKPPCAKPPETCQPVATFGNHVEKYHGNNNQPFISEFEASHPDSCTCACTSMFVL